jgi:hypothetical protein
MAARRPADDWPDFTARPRLQFWRLPSEVIESFAAIFPEFTRFPQRPSPTLDVCPLRNDPVRWRLKVAGYRAFFQLRQGRPLVVHILPRTEQTYRESELMRRRSSRGGT